MPTLRKDTSRGPWPPSRKLVGGLAALALLAAVAGLVATQLLGPTPPPATTTLQPCTGTASSPCSALDDCQDINTVAVLAEDGQASGRRPVNRASTAEAVTACVTKDAALTTAAEDESSCSTSAATCIVTNQL